MHQSLIPERARPLAFPLPPPVLPIIDFHMHVGGVEENRAYVRAAAAYGIERAVGLLHGVSPEELRDAFGDFFVPCAWAWRKSLDAPGFPEREIARLEDWHRRGVRIVKYKITPSHGRPPFFLDDARLGPVLAREQELGFIVQAHIAEPSCWWPGRFDPDAVGSKESYFQQVEHVLAHYPRLVFVGVHMGGFPENLEYLARLLERYPNFMLDTSATKWVVRELGRRREAARKFFLRFADRILLGTDLVVMFGDSYDYFTSRMHVQRVMWENSETVPGMIADPDAIPPDFPDGPEVRPLDLPREVLEKIYHDNAAKLLELAAR